MKKLKFLHLWIKLKLLKLVSKPQSVILTQDQVLRKQLRSVMDLKLPNVDLKEASFPAVRNKELQLPELLSESQRFFFLMRLLLHWMKIHKQKYLLPLTRPCREEPPLWLPTEWVPLRNATRSMFWTTEELKKKETSKLFQISQEASFLTWLKEKLSESN